MSSLYVHFSFFLAFFLFSLVAFFFSFLLSLSSPLLLSLSFLSSTTFPLSLSFYFDVYSSWFGFVVLLISTVIMIYSYYYMAPYAKSIYFLILTSLFVVSMLLVVFMSSLFFVILGWDGLGLVSFLLIVYYQNRSSIFSGTFTLLMNRIGDSFFLCSIVLYFFSFPDSFRFSSLLCVSSIVGFLVVTFMTKRAIFPFSPWLPMAIAAPTPISALVHSSTLVTSGLFLIMKYSYVLYSEFFIIEFLLISCVFTSFYAGINALFERDLKKLIALSTLSHLGFIGIAFSSGLLDLAFFHLLAHALFKSLLFITMGDIIVSLRHSQDIRYLSIGGIYTPFSCFIMFIALFNLLGLPAVSGFFSKDLVLERLNYSSFSFFLYFMVLFNLGFTFFYTYQLFYYSFQPNKLSPFLSLSSPPLFHAFLLAVLAGSTLVFGKVFLLVLFPILLFPVVPFRLKLLPLFLNFLFFCLLWVKKSQNIRASLSLIRYATSILFLYFFMTKLSSRFFYYSCYELTKSLELGVLNSRLNTKFPNFLFSLSKKALLLSMWNPLSSILLFGGILIFIIFFF